MKEPVDHIARPCLPWREGEAGLTECGFDALKVKTLSREEFFARKKELGRQRTAMLTCMICSETTERHGTWGNDPRAAMQREITWEYGGGYRPRQDRGERLKAELLVIASLIEAHRNEFDAAIDNYNRRREWIQRKADRKL